jgi:hypothetical protein
LKGSETGLNGVKKVFSASDQIFIDAGVKYWMMGEARGILSPKPPAKITKHSVPIAIYEPSYPNSPRPREIADIRSSGVPTGELEHRQHIPSSTDRITRSLVLTRVEHGYQAF